jgi:CRP/FNR family transcriptional regulator, nitrogen fixation regulation protein
MQLHKDNGRVASNVAVLGFFSPSIPVNAFSMRFARDGEIYGEAEPAEYIYKVMSGAVRTYTIDEDGHRQIDSFHLAGDIFGMETSPAHRFSAEAICDCEIAIAPRAAIERAAEQDGAAARELWSLTARQLGKVRDHMVMLGKKGAAERVVAFLLEMAGRTHAGNAFHLPMSRTDIADYLGLTIETVSRCFSKLERAHAIELAGARNVTLCNRGSLEAIAA